MELFSRKRNDIQLTLTGMRLVRHAETTQRTNEILQFLTVMSAVFLPLNLPTGLFGMNFAHLPLLQTSYGLWIVDGVMVMIVSGLMLWFRSRHWI